MKYLVTGVDSGLGKYLYNKLDDAHGLSRENSNKKLPESVDTIIHCAFNRSSNVENLYKYIDDNLFLTKRLLELHTFNKFIYISSVDVYNSNQTMYSSFKRYTEAVVSHYSNIVILRLPVLLGKGMKPNHITRMLSEKNPKLTLSSLSTFNYILYEDVLSFLNYYIHGTYDLISSGNVSLGEVAKELNVDVEFGDFVYETTNNFQCPIYTGRTSLETIREFTK